MFGARRRRQREMERRLRELDWLDQMHGVGAYGPAPRPPARPSRVPGFIALLLVAGFTTSAVFAVQPQVFPDRVHELLGTTPERLLPVRDIPSGPGDYSFIATQPESDLPVAYDPCQVIEVVINPEGAPGDHESLVAQALANTSDATGLQFELVGTTDERAFNAMSMRDPVLVLWSDEGEVPDLDGSIAGIGGSYRIAPYGGGRERYVTGFVVLDREDFADIRSDEIRQAIVDHEFGHVVGLGHVTDPRQLMYARGGHATEYGDGDLAGLAVLGSVPCR
jgi:hypothetical protein